MKRKILCLCLIAALLAIVSAGTLAYYTTTTRADNKVSTGDLSFRIHETSLTQDTVAKDTVVVLPGSTLNKTVTVENTGSHPLFMRVRLTVDITDDTLTTEDCVHMNINKENWTYQDGYYYYNTVLEPSAITEPLFTEVYIDGLKVDNRYLGEVFSLQVDGYAVQSEHNGEAPLEAQGWPEA